MNLELLMKQAFEAIKALEIRVAELEARYEQHTHEYDASGGIGFNLETSPPKSPDQQGRERE